MLEGLHPIEAAESLVSKVNDVVKLIKVNLVKTQSWWKCFYNEHKFYIEFIMRDKVLLSMKHLDATGEKKLVRSFVGTFSIVQRVGPLAYPINLGTCYGLVHFIFQISLLKSFGAGSNGYLHPTAVYIEDEQEWEVSGILRHKGSSERRKYLVAYSGYAESETYWLSLSKIYNALGIFNNCKVSHCLI